MRKVVVNTTPIIALADIGHLDLLRKLYGEIIIPQAVNQEILSEPAKRLVTTSDWIRVQEIENPVQKTLFSSRLHAGEIEVIMLAQECHADLLIIDDNAAKKTAKFFGLTVTGTMGVLLKAKREGYISAVKPLLKSLVNDGLYISQTIQNYVLRQAGESSNDSNV